VRRIPLRGRFDLIWCGSLLTHLDAPRWGEFLNFFARRLKPGGVCVFTTHGNYVATCMRDLAWGYGVPDQEGLVRDWSANGLSYRAYPDQPGYGVSLSSADWIRAQVARVPKLHWIAHHE